MRILGDNELALALEGLAGAAIVLLRSPPLEYGGMSDWLKPDLEKYTAGANRALQDAAASVSRAAESIRDLLATIPEAARERALGAYDGAADEALKAGLWRAWQVIDAHRRGETLMPAWSVVRWGSWLRALPLVVVWG